MNNDNSLATTSMLSTASQFSSSPIESTEIEDWSKAERLTFVPLNNNNSSLSETESFMINMNKMVLPAQQQQQRSGSQTPVLSNSNYANYHQPSSRPNYQSSLPRMPQGRTQNHYGHPVQNNQGQMPQNYQNQMPPQYHHDSPPLLATQNVLNARQNMPTQSQWMQNILAQNQQQQNYGVPGGAGTTGTRNVRSIWEQRIREERVQKQVGTRLFIKKMVPAVKHEEMTKSRLSLAKQQFLFPRWRSVDPMTASLVASARTTQLVPRDSRMPEYRQEKLMETERAAQQDKFELHKPYIQMAIYRRHQKRGRSLLAPRNPYDAEEIARRSTMALYDESTGQWYNPDQIRQAVSHESIANVGATRQMWEQTSWQEMAKSDFEREQERQQHFAQQRYYLQ